MSAPAGHHRDDDEPDLNALAGWVDGRLDASQRADLAAHLAECQQCRAIVADLTRGATPAASSWRPALAIAATVAIAAIGGGAYFLVRDRAQPPAATTPPLMQPANPPAAPGTPPPATQEPAARATTPPAAAPLERDRTRAAGHTAVHGKTFHLVAGEWIDDGYRERDFLPVVDVSSRRQLDSIAALAPYTTLGSHFTVVIRGTVYRVALP